jgi:hypothetical protein
LPPGAPFFDRNPPCQIDERFGGAHRALLPFVDLFAVEAQARGSELHPIECTRNLSVVRLSDNGGGATGVRGGRCPIDPSLRSRFVLPLPRFF